MLKKVYICRNLTQINMKIKHNKELNLFIVSLEHGYTFAYNHVTNTQYIHKANGDVVSAFAWMHDLTVSEFIKEVEQAQECATLIHETVGNVINNIKSIGGQQ